MDIRGHNVSSSIVSTNIIFVLYLTFNEVFYNKFITAINWNFNLKFNTDPLNFYMISKIFPLFHLDDMKLFSIPLPIDLISIFLILLMVYIGGVFPDLDQTYLKPYRFAKLAQKNREQYGETEGKTKNTFLYQQYHRQCTHSPLHFIVLFGLIAYYNFSPTYSNTILFLYYFEIGVATHLVADIFVGSGGIPSLCVAKWNSNARIKFKILENNNVIMKGLVYIHFTILLILSIITLSKELIIALVLYSYMIQIKTAKMVFLQGSIILMVMFLIYLFIK
jgi:hypothetical protein